LFLLFYSIAIICIFIAFFRRVSTGTIELDEIRQVMRKLGQNPTEEELTEMISSVDDNNDKEIDFEEFLILMKSRCEVDPQDPEKELRDAFAVFDSDGSGSIDRKELKRLMKKLGQALTEAEVDAMMDEVDSNGDGEISYDEFKSMMVRTVSYCFVLFLQIIPCCLLASHAKNYLHRAACNSSFSPDYRGIINSLTHSIFLKSIMMIE